MSKKYDSVLKMTDDLIDDKEFTKDLKKEITSKKIAKILSALRCSNSLTQGQLAEKTGFSQAKISKIENSKDVNLTIGDLTNYCNSVGMQLEIGFSKQGLKLADWVKFHFFKTMNLLGKMRGIPKEDETIRKGIEKFHEEVLFNFSKGLLDCLQKVKSLKKEPKTLYVSEPVTDVDEMELVPSKKKISA